MRNIVLLFVFLGLYTGQLHCQGLDIQQRQAGKNLFAGINIIPARSQFMHEGSGLKYDQTNLSTINGSIEAGIMFGRRFSISLGLGYFSCKGRLTIDETSGTYQAADSENDNYEMRWTGSDIKEDQNIGYLCLPLNIGYRIPLSKKLGLYGKGGLMMNLPLTKEYVSTGTFSYNGYYPAYNVLYTDLPEYGFPSNKKVKYTGEVDIKSINMQAFISAGISVALSAKLHFLLGGYYTGTMGNILSSGNPSDDQLTRSPSVINSVTHLGNKTLMHSTGINAGLVFLLKKIGK